MGEQRGAVSVDCPYYVVVYVGVGAVAANVGLELRLVIQSNNEHGLAEGAHKVFLKEYELDKLANPSEAKSVNANAFVVPQVARHGEAYKPTVVHIEPLAFAVYVCAGPRVAVCVPHSSVDVVTEALYVVSQYPTGLVGRRPVDVGGEGQHTA